MSASSSPSSETDFRAGRDANRRAGVSADPFSGATDGYADFGRAPFSTPGYQRERAPKTRHERRRERRDARRDARRQERERRRTERHRHDIDIDVERPLARVMSVPEIKRFLRIPVVGLVALILLVVLRTGLWMVLGVILPRLLHVVQRFTGARLDDAVDQTTLVGTTLKDQLTRVTGHLRETTHDDEDEVRRRETAQDQAPRYRVAANDRERFDARVEDLANTLEKRAAEFEAEVTAAARNWDQRSRK